MKPCDKKILRLSCWATILLLSTLILLCLVVVAAEKIYGGAHVVLAGQSFGFSIGMRKGEVFDKYRTLDESENIRAYGADGVARLALGSRPSDLKMTPDFEASDHWMAYRRKWPIYFQDFYFADGKLTNITTYIRFYETP